MRAAMEAQGQLPPVLTNKYSALGAGDPGTSVDSMYQQNCDVKSKGKKHPLVKVTSKDRSSVELSQEAETILDTGEIKLVKSLLQGSSADSPDSASMYYFGFDPTSGIPASIPLPSSGSQEDVPVIEEEIVQEQVVPRHSPKVGEVQEKNIPAVNLSQFDQFSILHFQDKRDPQHNVVMIETPEAKKLCKQTDVFTEELSVSAGIFNGGINGQTESGNSLSGNASSQKKSFKLQGSEEGKSFEEVLCAAQPRTGRKESQRDKSNMWAESKQTDNTNVSSVKRSFGRQGALAMDDYSAIPSAGSSQSGIISNSSNFDEGLTNYEMDSGIFDMTQGRDSQACNKDATSSHAVDQMVSDDIIPKYSTPILEESKQQSVIGDRPKFSYRVFQIKEGISFEDDQTEEERLQQIDGDDVLSHFLNENGTCAMEEFDDFGKEVTVARENIEPIAKEVAMVTGTLENDEDEVTGIVKDIRRCVNIPDDLVFNEEKTSVEDSIIKLEDEIHRRDLKCLKSPLSIKYGKSHEHKTVNSRAEHPGLNILSDANHPSPAPAAMSKYSSTLPTAAEVQVYVFL